MLAVKVKALVMIKRVWSRKEFRSVEELYYQRIQT